jgi:signal transduction histidine kinase/CheY-like chemotaxis protein
MTSTETSQPAAKAVITKDLPPIVEVIEGKARRGEAALLFEIWAPAFIIFGLMFTLAVGVIISDETPRRCSANSHGGENTRSILIIMSTGATVGHFIIQISRFLKRIASPESHLFSSTMLLLMTGVQAVSQTLAVTSPKDLYWEDFFGVRSSPYLWLEWLSTVPIMFYLVTIMNVNKLSLTTEDIGVLATSTVGLLCLYVLNFPFAKGVGGLLMLAANILMEAALAWLHMTSFWDYSSSVREARLSNDDSPLTGVMLQVKESKLICSTFMHIAFTLFPIAYFLSAIGVIDHLTLDTTICILNFVSKGIFAMLVNDVHTEVLDSKTFILFAEREKSLERERKSMEREREQLRSLIGNVAHDLKTPLQSIIMDLDMMRTEMTDLVKTGDAPTTGTVSGASSGGSGNSVLPLLFTRHKSATVDRMFSILDSLIATCSFMKMAINRSVDFTKASSDIALVPVVESVDLAAAIALPVTCVNHLQSDVEIIFDPLPANICPFVLTDKHWLSENTLCMLSNAVKYSNGNPVRLTVEFIDPSTADAKQHSSSLNAVSGIAPFGVPLTLGTSVIIVTVEDGGIGISPEDRRLLFKPLRQASRLNGGTGLGLYSMAKRIEALNGAYGMNDRKDGKQGSAFWFAVPYKPDTAAAAKRAAATAAAAHAAKGASRDPLPSIAEDVPVLIPSHYQQQEKHQPLMGKNGAATDDRPHGGGRGGEDPSGEEAAIQSARSNSTKEAHLVTLHEVAKALARVSDNPGLNPEGAIAAGGRTTFFGAAKPLVLSTAPVTPQGARSMAPSRIESPMYNSLAPSRRGSFGSGTETPMNESLSVLIVEDSIAIVKVTTRLLTHCGHTVAHELNGSLGLDRMTGGFATQAYDVVLMDLQMPVMDGIEATKRFREFEKNQLEALAAAARNVNAGQQQHDEEPSPQVIPRRLAIIGMSANSDSVSRQSALDAGMDLFLAKPFNIADLQGALKAVFSA